MSAEVTGSYVKVFPEPLCLLDSPLCNSRFGGRYLTRPVFIDAADLKCLLRDLDVVQSLLADLPRRLFGGDMTAFARALGLTDEEATAVVRSDDPAGSSLARADLYRSTSGFSLLELNAGSALGGTEVGDLCAATARSPGFQAFAASHGLVYRDPMLEQLETLRHEAPISKGAAPVVALTDWPSSFAHHRRALTERAKRWTEMGIRTIPCHVGQLTRRRGAIRLGSERIDIVYRHFVIDNLLDGQAARSLLEPLLRAADRGEVRIFTPLQTELYGAKSALAMLSDPADRCRLDQAELRSVDRLVPWTRLARGGRTALEDGRPVDLYDHVRSNRSALVLKPAFRYGGRDVTAGWDPGMDDERWYRHVERAFNGAYVVQRRVRPAAETFPEADGQSASWFLNWGIFKGHGGYGGILIRADRDDASGVINGSRGTVGCCFHPPLQTC